MLASLDARVVPGGNEIGPHGQRMIEKGAKFDLGVAQYIRVGRAPGLVFGKEFGEHALLVLGREVDDLDVDSEAHRP